MSHSSIKKNTLEGRHYVTLIMRLSFDQDGQLSNGELVDTVGSQTRHFKDRLGLERAVDGSLKQLSESFTTANQPKLESSRSGNSTDNPD